MRTRHPQVYRMSELARAPGQPARARRFLRDRDEYRTGHEGDAARRDPRGAWRDPRGARSGANGSGEEPATPLPQASLF